VKNEHLKEEIEDLQEQKEATREEVRHVYDMKDEARDKYLAMDEYIRRKDNELTIIETKLQKAKQEYEPYRVQEELNLIYELFPMMKEQLRIADLCQTIGFTIDAVKQLLKGITITIHSGKLYSPEHDQRFEVKDTKVKIDKESDNPNNLRLAINGMNVVDWFRMKRQEFMKSIGMNVRQPQDRNRGRR
jgi:predicted nuclease with TOPRIM domain